jgi:hypothetical protein
VPILSNSFCLPGEESSSFINVVNVYCGVMFVRAEFLKLWSADHKWSSGSAFVALLG